MSKKTGSLMALSVAAALTVGFLLFGRGGGVSAQPTDAGPTDTNTSSGSGVFGLTPDSAVELATAIPASWAYDPDTRVVRPERSRLGFPVNLTASEWLSRLTEQEYHILREQGTERAWTGALNANHEEGIYYSRATGQPLFSSDDKYDSGSGWPSFTRPINPNAIVYIEDNDLFSRRIEVVDSLSGSHLGHVFNDGPAPTGQRYCINSAALIFVPTGGEPPEVLMPDGGE